MRCQRIVRTHTRLTPEHAQMIGFDCDGFDVRADGRTFRFALPEPVFTAG